MFSWKRKSSFASRTQPRFLENGIDIVVVETTEPTIGVDTEEELQAVAALLAGWG